MAKDFDSQLHKVRRRLYYLINEKTRKFSESLSRRIAQIFVDRARRRLFKYAKPLEANSRDLVAKLAYSIDFKQVDSGYWSVKIPADEEGLFLFLEFGTGLDGKNFTTNADKYSNTKSDPFNKWVKTAGWDYAQNKANYFEGGWVFKYDGKPYTPYLTETDSFPLTHEKKHTRKSKTAEYKVKSYRRRSKKGKIYTVSTYTRKSSPRSESQYAKNQRVDRNRRVFTTGIIGTRYLYDTKQEIIRLFRTLSRFKNGKITIFDVNKKLSELERSDV